MNLHLTTEEVDALEVALRDSMGFHGDNLSSYEIQASSVEELMRHAGSIFHLLNILNKLKQEVSADNDGHSILDKKIAEGLKRARSKNK